MSSKIPNAMSARARASLRERGQSGGTARSTISTIVDLGGSTSTFSLAIFTSSIVRRSATRARRAAPPYIGYYDRRIY